MQNTFKQKVQVNKRIFVRLMCKNLTKEKVLKELIKMGLKKENLFISDCFRKCECKKMKKEDIVIYLGFILIKPTIKSLCGDIISLLIKGSTKKSIFEGGDLGFCLSERRTIFIDTGRCWDFGISIFGTLKHELLHLKLSHHCKSKNCLFSRAGSSSTTSLCNNCEIKFKKLVGGLNGKV